MSKKKGGKARPGAGGSMAGAVAGDKAGKPAGARGETTAAERSAPKDNAMADEVQEPIRALSDAPTTAGGARETDIPARLERIEAALASQGEAHKAGSPAQEVLARLERVESMLSALTERVEPHSQEAMARMERIEGSLKELSERAEKSEARPPSGGGELTARLEHIDSALSALAGRFETASAARDAEFMTRLDKLDRMEASLSAMAEKPEPRAAGVESGQRANEVLAAILKGLSDVNGAFKAEDLAHLTTKAVQNVRNLISALDQLENVVDFARTAEPLFKVTAPRVIAWFDELERKGVLGLANGLVAALERVAERHGPEDLAKLGDALSLLIRAADKLCCPEAQCFIEHAASAPSRMDMARAESMGLRDVLRAARDMRTRRGLAVLLELTRAMAPEEKDEAERFRSS